MIYSTLNKEINSKIVLNAIGFFFLLIIVYIIGFAGSFLVTTKFAWLVALIWTSALVIVGLLYKWNGYHNEWEVFDTPWDVNSVGSYVSQRELLKLTGNAYIISEVILSCSGCLLNVFDGIRRKSLLVKIDNNSINSVVRPLIENANRGQRFQDGKVLNLNLSIVKPLILLGAIWCKKDGDKVLLGIDRRFDKLSSK